jgi:hypothetical protein
VNLILKRRHLDLSVVEVLEGRDVQICLIDTGFLMRIRKALEDLHDPAGYGFIKLKVRPDEDCFRFASPACGISKPPSARDRQRRADAKSPCLIVGSHDHTSTASVLGIGADYQRKSTQSGVRPLLDRRVKGVHIDVNDDAHQMTRERLLHL